MAKAFTLKDWLAFMEVFGMPIRIGTYNPETIKEGERATLRNALANIGHDAAAMIPEGMNIDIVESMNRGSGGESLFGGLADYLDKQVSKAVLGQTMTTDDGSSLAQAAVHQDVFQQYLRSDAKQVSNTINDGLTRPWCQFNYGDNAPCCRLVIDTSPPEDLASFTTAALPWVEKAGLRVGSSWVREKFGIPDPEEDGEQEVLGGDTAERKMEEAEKIREEAPAPDEAPGAERAQNRALPPIKLKDVVQTEQLVDDAAPAWSRVMQPHTQALIDLAKSAQSYDEFSARLVTLAEEFGSDPFVDLLAQTMAKARAIGDQED
jgi:phage gp29-like protein